MQSNNMEKSLVEEINTNWDSVPIKYDNFHELYMPAENDQPTRTQNEMENMRNLENNFKYALTFKQAPLNHPNQAQHIDETKNPQNISEDHIKDVQIEIDKKTSLILLLDDVIKDFEEVILRVERPKTEIDAEKDQILKLIKMDFMKQQKYLVTAVQLCFPKQEATVHKILNALFDAYFENSEKFVDARSFSEPMIQELIKSELVEIQNENSKMIKLKKIL